MTSPKRNAIVTGAAQGVGQAAAERLVSDGCTNLILIDVAADKLAATAEKLRQSGAEVEALVLDLTDINALQTGIAGAVARLGQVDILINAAGTTARGGLVDLEPDVFNLIFNLNVRAPLFIMQAVAPAMPRGGVIVNICSMLAYGGPPFLLAYSASKSALVTVTKGAANTLKWDGVRVFGINLGWTWTPAEQETQTKVHGLPENWAEEIGKNQPFGRLLFPQDPAGVVGFLTSSDASMMTGAIIDLDQFVAGTVDDNPGAATT